MYGLAQNEAWRQRPEEIRHEVAANRLQRKLRVNHETRPHVMPDLSWERARSLDTQSFATGAPETPTSANGN